MKKIFLLLIGLLISNTVLASTTYYVRVGGGTATQCTGTTNADYSGSGSGQSCAFNHPSWVMGATGTTAKWIGGDTMIIDDNIGTAQFPVGYGMPNTSGCSAFGPVDCVLNNIPSGIDVNHPTKILGSAYASGCSTKPQLYGTQSVKQVLKMQSASNIDIECIEVTDHSNCGFRVGASFCSEAFSGGQSVGTYGREGIGGAGVANLTLINDDIHGMSDRNLLLGDLSGVSTIRHVNIDGAYEAGWDGDTRAVYGGTGALNTGTMIIDHVNTRFNGCQESYPRSASFTAADYGNCVDQNANPPGYGDGWATYDAGGTYNITYSNWSHNAQDGLDFLYCPNNCVFNIDKSTFEGNDGNQLKVTAKTLNVTNSEEIANCNYLRNSGKVYNTSTWTDCRANGSPISVTVVAGSNYLIENNTAYSSTGSGGSPFIEVISRYGTCNGTETYTYKNNVLYSPDAIWQPYYNGLAGACSTAWNASTTDHSNIYHFQSNPAGTGNVFTNPLFATALSITSNSNLTNLYLQSGSPAKGTASSGLSFWNTSTDINNFSQNSPTDMGAAQFGTTLTLTGPGQSCIATSDCAIGSCSSFACSGSCSAVSVACSANSQCCSNNCASLACAVAPTCGDGTVQAGEICDGSNLNGSTCIQQGFTGGSLTCAADCKSFVTSSCNNTVAFPLTPILDSAIRSNSTGISSTNWVNLVGSFNISSNAFLPVTGSNSTNLYYWGASLFGPDVEVYTTISNKGSNGDDLELYARYNPTTGKGYKLEPDIAGGQIHIYRVDPGENQLGATIAQTFSSGDSIGMSIVGSTLTIYYKASGGSWVSKGTRTDSTYTSSGNVALGSFTGAGVTPDIKFTNFGGGSLNPITCGNGLKEAGEVCDGSDLASQSCVTQGYASGTLTCSSNCQSFVTSSCVTASVCGNNTKETGEICDGTDKASQTCAGLGFASGTLSCAADCKSFVTTSCISGGTSGITGGVTIK